MDNFKKIQGKLKLAKKEKAKVGREVFVFQEKLKKLDAKRARLARIADEQSDELQNIIAEQNNIRRIIAEAEQNFDRLHIDEVDFLNVFNPFTDPRKHFFEFSDAHPVLLCPVRLETRFKKIEKGGRLQHQLWVRVFPDECSIDTFEELPSESEIKNATDYWVSVWSAGKSEDETLTNLIQNRKKAAWRVLGGGVQAGRAYWLIQNYQPTNLTDLPERTNRASVILTIPSQDLPANKEAISDYWKSYWVAQNDEVLITTAFNVLSSIVGGDVKANELISNYTPSNLTSSVLPEVKVWYISPDDEDTVRPAAENEVILKILLGEEFAPEDKHVLSKYWISFWKADGDVALQSAALQELTLAVGDATIANQLTVNYRPSNIAEFPFPDVTVSYLQLPKTENVSSKQSAWSKAARITSFPERFVLMGYKGKSSDGTPVEVLNEIGSSIPDPLIVGPNPSIDADRILKDIFIEDFNALTSEQIKEDKLGEFYNNSVEFFKATILKEDFIDNFKTLSDADKLTELETVFDQQRDDVKAGKYVDYLCQRSETQWLFDFEKAVDVGMGFKINLSKSVYDNGFDRLFVLGVKLSADEEEGKNSIEALFKHHHFGNSGFSIVPQGTPTNNTEEENSGFSDDENFEETYSRYFPDEVKDDPIDDLTKKDGRWLAELLGIDVELSTLKLAENYYQTDQSEARAMNRALFNTTLGYFMESMISPLVNDQEVSLIKSFFNEFVSGRGGIPAIRIGNQPYGILPISKIKNSNWLFQEENNLLNNSQFGNSKDTLQNIYSIVLAIREDFEALLNPVAYVGKEGDAHKILLEVLGLHATSVEFDQRIAQSFAHMYNRAKLSGGLAKLIAKFIEGFYKKRGLDLLAELGYTPDKEEALIPILEKFFFTKQNRIKKDLIDDQPLSESKPIRAYTTPENEGAQGQNYIEWLIENAKISLNKIKNLQGFENNKNPNTLLFQMLRQAVIIGYSNTSFELYKNASILSPMQIKAAKIDKDFIGIKINPDGFESKWNYLDIKVDQINNANLTVADHISSLMSQNIGLTQTYHLHAVLEALELLKEVPTARLERVFSEHLDSCSYRLDAWLMGFIRMQLQFMRKQNRQGLGSNPNPGLYIGAYGWVENLTPDDDVFTPVNLEQPLKSIFDPDNDIDIVKDSNNGGYIHAPSINQAMTASILRNAYISNAAVDNPTTYKINLSSERVRMALSIIEGMKHGQSLGALLGYQLERGLHDRTDVELDIFIYELRKIFPLVANQNKQTETEDDEQFETDKAITKIEARNVVDGLKLINQIKKSKKAEYPFGIAEGAGLKKLKLIADPAIRAAINKEVNRILNINDAVADLAMAEGIHQVIQSNFDRAAGNLDTYSKGSFPQTPDVIRTPRSGVSITHRVGMQLKPGIIPDAASNPRVLAEPAINEFLEYTLPDLADIVCNVILTTPAYMEGESPTVEERIITMKALELTPIDLLYLIDADSGKSLTALDDYILKRIHDEIPNLRPDTTVQIMYTEHVAGKKSILQISPLIKSLNNLLLSARPLQNSDMMLPNEASTENNESLIVDKTRIVNVFDKFLDVFVDKNNFDQGIILLNHSINLNFDEEFSFTNAITLETLFSQLDSFISSFINDLSFLNRFGLQQAGFGFVYDRKATIYSEIYQKVLHYRNRWLKKMQDFNDLIIASSDPSLVEEQRIDLLLKAERIISTSYTNPLPDTPDPLDPIGNFEAVLMRKRALFEAKLNQINQDWLEKSFTTFENLNNAILNLKEGKIRDPNDNSIELDGNLSLFDLLPLETETEEKQIVILAEDMVAQVTKINTLLISKAKVVDTLLSSHDAVLSLQKKVELLTKSAQELLGQDFKIIPEFELGSDHKIELNKSYEDRIQLLSYQMQKDHVDFPVDDWLYGVSRVREKMNHWENITMLSEGMKNSELELSPLQLPYRENDTWLALDYSEKHKIDSDKILYTAYFREFDVTKKQCGLLIDEWTEVIPTKEETTGLTFQYDQPNAEPPQAMLLATPSVFTGQWDWNDLVGSLHEALDLAKLRAIEPEHIEKTAYAQFLPATISAVSYNPLVTIGANYVLDMNVLFNTNTE